MENHLLLLGREIGDQGLELTRLCHSFAVGKIRAHHDRIAVAQVPHNLDDVVLGIRTDPDVALEDGAGSFGQRAADPWPPSPHAATLVEMAHEMGYPFGAEL